MKMYYFNYSKTIQLHNRTKRAIDVCAKFSSHHLSFFLCLINKLMRH